MANQVTDHLGNIYPSKNAMCKHYGISKQVLKYRLQARWSLKDALTIEFKNAPKKSVDHLGNVFKSKLQMCNHYGIDTTTYEGRLKKGLSIEQALTTKDKCRKICKDHLGNEYKSKSHMARAYNLNMSTLNGRLKKGWSLEKALTTPLGETTKTKLQVKDHLNNTFDNIRAMCNYYGINQTTFNTRIQSGMSLKEALTTPKCKTHKPQTPCTDHLGVTFESTNAMCRHHGVSKESLKRRLQKGWSLEQALTVPNIKHFGKYDEILTIVAQYDISYFYVIYDNTNDIWTAQELKDYMNRKEN